MSVQEHIDKAVKAHEYVLKYREMLITERNDPQMHSILLNEMRDCVDDIVIHFLNAINELTGAPVSVNLKEDQKYLARHSKIIEQGDKSSGC